MATQTTSSSSDRINKPLMPSESNHFDQPIIWALDPTEKDADHLQPLAKAIESWRHTFSGDVLPVAVLSPSELNWPVECVAPLNEKLIYVANEHLKPAVRKAFREKNLDTHILLHSGISHRQAARELLNYAKKRKAQLIAVYTHGRRGLNRFALGSFAELLLTQDDIPVLALNPHAEAHAEIRRIAFPTDFSNSSKRAFENAIKLAKAYQAELVLIHIYSIPNQFFFDGEFGFGVTSTMVQQAWKDAEDTQRRLGEHWAQSANENGIHAELVFNMDTGRTGELITKVASEQNADLVYLSTSYGKVGQTFLGGTVRDVLATSNVAVLVKHFKEN